MPSGTYYTSDDVRKILDMKSSDYSNIEIARAVGGTAGGIQDVVRRSRRCC